MEQLFEKLNKTINEYDNVIVMGHKDPDLDSLGSCLGLYEVIESMGKKPYLFLNINHLERYNANINQAFQKMEKDVVCVDEKNYYNIKGKTLIIISDVHTVDRLEYPNIVEKYDILVLDHHIKSKKYIKNTKFMYIDSNLSSMSELITFYIKYNNIKINYVIATVLLGGIEIDTNSFNIKTTNKTYDAASILMELGADSIMKQELLKETKEEYIKRANFIKNSFMATKNVAMCVTSSIANSLELAETAEELLTFEDVDASFVLGKLDDNLVGISARSLGNVDVSLYMKKLGGGGHASNAATQIKDKSLKEVKQELLNLLIVDNKEI